jgi:hypothetical protein
MSYELLDGGEHNPYHLFIYMLANFRTVDCRYDVYYYYPNKRNCKLSEEALSLLPPNFHRHLVKEEGRNYIPFRNMKQNFTDWAIPNDYKFLRTLFHWHFSPTVTPGLFLYVSRNKDAKQRRVINEDALLPIFKDHNFQIVHMSELHVKEQIELFSKADFIVSPHGAALSFLLFCNQNVSVLEFMPINKEARHFSHMAWHFNYDYKRILSDTVDESNCDLYVPPQELKNYLEYHPKTKKSTLPLEPLPLEQ